MNDGGVVFGAHVREYAALTNVLQACGAITPVKSIAERMRTARERRGWSQADLARESGVSAGTIGNVESGARKVPREILAIAAALQVDPNWLRNGIGSGIPTPSGHRTKGANAHPRDFAFSDHSLESPSQTGVEVPIRYIGRTTSTGGIALDRVQSGGTVAAPFAGPTAFALQIDGDALDPFAMSGDLLVVDPGQPLRGDQRVLIQLRDGTALLCHLIAQRETEVTTQGIVTKVRTTLQTSLIERISPVVLLVSRASWADAP